MSPHSSAILAPPATERPSVVGTWAVRGGLACLACRRPLAGWAQARQWIWTHAMPIRPRTCPGLVVPDWCCCYLLCFTPRYHHAGHYIGTAERSGLTSRLGQHAAGRGANLVAVVLEAGRTVELVRVWPGGGYRLERSLKNRHGTTICPRCPSPPSRRLPRLQRTVQARLFDPRPYQWPPPGEEVAR